MAIALVPRSGRALSDQLNGFYRVLKGIDADSLTLRLASGGSFVIRHSVTNAALFSVTDAGPTLPGGLVVTGALSTEGAVDVHLPPGGAFNVRHSGTDAVVFAVTDLGPQGSFSVLDGSITTPKLADGAVTLQKIAPFCITTSEQVLGTTSDPSMSSSTAVTIPQMTTPHTFAGGFAQYLFWGIFKNTSAGSVNTFDLVVDGAVVRRADVHAAVAGNGFTVMLGYRSAPAAGTRTVEVKWSTNAGTLSRAGTLSTLYVIEWQA